MSSIPEFFLTLLRMLCEIRMSYMRNLTNDILSLRPETNVVNLHVIHALSKIPVHAFTQSVIDVHARARPNFPRM